MDLVVLDHISFELEPEDLLSEFRVPEGQVAPSELLHLIGDAEAIARPKALYKMAYIDSKGDDHVVMEGIKYTSRVLRVNLERAHRAFPYVATCGAELEEWANSIDDVLQRYWVDTVCLLAVRVAVRTVGREISGRYGTGKISRMNPGSLPDWPLEEQRPLFQWLGDTKRSIGVELTESLMMRPRHSVSGIFFPSEASFESCQLCPRVSCPGRRSPYDPALYDAKYRRP
jgi:hypothetical protein